MFLYAILIYRIAALLTFSEVSFYLYEVQKSILELILVDENLKVVQDEKVLQIEIVPMLYAFTNPSLIFTGTLGAKFFFGHAKNYYFIISCDGCEIYTTNTLFIDKENTYSVSITPQSTDYKANEEIIIDYYPDMDFRDISAFLINKEEIFVDYFVGKIGVTFFKTGEKHLMVLLTWTDYTYVLGLTILIPTKSYSTIEFFNTFVIFI